MDFVDPDERFSVAKYKKMAEQKIDELVQKGITPIIVGGTGLYVDCLVEGIEFQEVEIDLEYRNTLKEIAEKEGLQTLYNKLKEIDPISADRISPNDFKRISRALEVYKTTGKTITEQNRLSKLKGVKYDYIMFGLNMKRELLYDRINKRVDLMIEQGLIQEVEDILKRYGEFPTSMQALGYKEVKQYIEGNYTKDEMIDKLKMETRRYAKRQLTWFRRYKQINWLDATEGVDNNIRKIITRI